MAPLVLLYPPAKPETLGHSTVGDLWKDCKKVFDAILRMKPLPVVDHWHASTMVVLSFVYMLAGKPLALTLAEFFRDWKDLWMQPVAIYRSPAAGDGEDT